MFKELNLKNHNTSLFRILFSLFCSLTIIGCGGGSPDSEALSDEFVLLESISLSAVSEPLKKGDSSQLSIIGTYSDASTQDLSARVSWSSGDTSIISISESGLLQANAAGTTQISASIDNFQSNIQVEVIDLTNLDLSSISTSLSIGDTQQLSVTGTYSNNSTEDLSSATSWSSSNNTIISISNTGLITVKNSGTASITASLDELSDTQIVNIATTPTPIVTLESISLDNADQNLIIDDQVQLSVTGTYSDGSTEAITSGLTWLSSQANVASISETGQLLALTTGTTQITVTAESLTSTIQATVTNSLISISLSGINENLKIGETQQLVATGLYANNDTSDLSSSVNWTSSDSDTLSISETGLVTATAAGTATLTATLDAISGNIQATAIAVLTGISLDNADQDLIVDDQVQLSVTATYSDSSSEAITTGLTWLSSQDSVASISETGQLLALTTGTTQITVSSGSFTSSIQVTVTNSLMNITVSGINENLKIGETQQLAATGSYANSDTADLSSSVSWTSSDNGILSISGTGLVTAVTAGTATLTATLDAVSGNTQATAIALVDISLSPSFLTLAIDSSEQFTATGRYSDSSTEDLTDTVNWASDNSSIATISTSPAETAGKLNSVAAGTSNITASIDAVSSSISITVSPATLQTIEISAPESIAAGISEQIIATGMFNDGSTQDLSNQLSWTVDDPSIATIVEESGLLSSIQQGSITITASNGALSATKALEISPATLSSIIVTPSTLSIAKGREATINVTAIFSDQSHQDVSDQVEWESDNASVANIATNSPTVETNNVGTANLTATLSGYETSLQVIVTNATLLELSILPINSSFPKGLSQTFSASGRYTDGSVQDLSTQVTWISSNEAICTIDNNAQSEGDANGIDVGTVSITATLDGISKSSSLTVDNALLTTIEILPTNTSVAKGIEVQTTATGHYSDGSKIDISDLVEWDSSDDSVATVSASTSGLIHSLKQGSALISAQLDNISGLANISISSATLQSISVDAASSSLPIGIEQTLTATGTYSDATNVDISQQVTWQSTQNTILTVDNAEISAGLARALTQGEVAVSATLEGISGDISLTVTEALLSEITISANASSININSALQVTAIATYSDNSTQDVTQQVNWASSDDTAASINNVAANKGLVQGVALGQSSITASLNGVTSNSLTIDISQDPNLPNSISLNLSPNVILNNLSDSTQVQATILPAIQGGVVADGTSVEFTITEGATSRVESANSTNGIASLSITSSYDGMISIEASINSDISTQAGLLSTTDFSSAFVTNAQAQAAYSDNKLLKGSILLMMVRNLSNRTFNIPQINVAHGILGSLIHLPGSPVTDVEFTSGGALTGGEFTAFGYGLDDDIEDSLFLIIYDLVEPTTNTNFNLGSVYSFE